MNNEQLVRTIKQYREAIEQTKQDVSRDEGQYKALLDQLLQLTEAKDLDSAIEVIERWKREKDDLEKKITEDTEKMMQEFPL